MYCHGFENFILSNPERNLAAARGGRDALAKEIYESTFDHVVKKINEHTCTKLKSSGESHGTW